MGKILSLFPFPATFNVLSLIFIPPKFILNTSLTLSPAAYIVVKMDVSRENIFVVLDFIKILSISLIDRGLGIVEEDFGDFMSIKMFLWIYPS